MPTKEQLRRAMVEGWDEFVATEPTGGRTVASIGFHKMWANNRYVVLERRLDADENGWRLEGMVWLSIRRTDRAPIHDWRDLQRIKNELCGREREAVEIYPAESRVVDESNQYHLWVMPSGFSFPFGYKSRSVLGPDDVSKDGAVQREFEA